VELEWLQTFVIAAEEENFRKAADRLHLAQPTITLHIQKLEQAWGVSLFERTGRHVKLSAGGQHLLAIARRLLETYQASREEMARWQQGYEDTVTIAVSPLVASTILPTWIRRFTTTHPSIEFSIQVKESQTILEYLLQHECDLGLSRLAVHHPDVTSTQLYSDPIVMVAPSDVQDLEGPPPDPAELLSTYPVLTHNHPDYWDSLVVTLRKRYPQIRTMQVSQVHVALHWIMEKAGVSFLPASTVRRELMRGTISEIQVPDLMLPVAHTYLLTNRGGTTQSADLFSDFVQGYMKERRF
jgi:LysR family transcriptional regulator, repressor for citA